jgi:Bacterial capsule synthesis protein PGA_cap
LIGMGKTIGVLSAGVLVVAACWTGGASAAEVSPGGAAGSVTIAAVGDTMLGSTPDLPPDPGSYLSAVRSELDRGAQVVFGNLEGTLTTATASKCGTESATCFAFRDPPGYARYLKRAGFTVLNDANNHSFDFGAAGQAQTVRSLHAAGLAQTGLPGEIIVVQASGIKVAFAAFAPYPYDASLLNLPTARSLIERARREAQVVVVYMHAGAEGSGADHVTGRAPVPHPVHQHRPSRAGRRRNRLHRPAGYRGLRLERGPDSGLGRDQGTVTGGPGPPAGRSGAVMGTRGTRGPAG